MLANDCCDRVLEAKNLSVVLWVDVEPWHNAIASSEILGGFSFSLFYLSDVWRECYGVDEGEERCYGSGDWGSC